LGLALATGQPGAAPAQETPPRFFDLSLLVAPEYPCTWPTFPAFQMNPARRIGPLSPYNVDTLIYDGNTGTQLDVPPHSVTPLGSGLANSGPFGTAYTDKIPPWQFCGEACVVDCRDLLDTTPPGRSDLVTRERIQLWEREHRALGPGDVVLFYSGYSDKYYRPFPEGSRYAAEPVAAKAPAWPDPDPDCMEYLASRNVLALATDSVSMGPLPDLAEPTHYAGLKHGMIWVESGTGFGQLPATGAFFCMLAPKHAGDPYAECRAFAIGPGPLASRLIDSARRKRVVDLSVALAEDLPCTWPGAGIGNHRQAYFTIKFGLNPNLRTPFVMHMFDSQAGTHLVPPAFALPPEGFDNGRYAPQVREWLAAYEADFGPRGHSRVTTEQVPIEQTCGPMRVVDLRALSGTVEAARWPASPLVSAEFLARHEQNTGRFKPGEMVVLRTDWTDRFYQPLPVGNACLADPLNGKCEGWPALDASGAVYLAERGIRCVATDAPSLGGVDPRQALATYWALGTRGLVAVEFLTNVGRVPDGAWMLFAAVRIRDCHGGPGRALAFY